MSPTAMLCQPRKVKKLTERKPTSKSCSMQVEEFLEQSARRFPEKTALICAERRLSYKQIEEQSNRLAHGLISMGIRRGDRVALYLDNSVESVLSIFAVLKAGAIFSVINPE